MAGAYSDDIQAEDEGERKGEVDDVDLLVVAAARAGFVCTLFAPEGRASGIPDFFVGFWLQTHQ
jgi:hypothetical protein